MKKLLGVWCLTMLMVMCVGVSSCSDELSDSSIVGTWVFVNLTADIQHPDPEEVDDAKEMIALISLFAQGSTIEFKADKTFIWTVVGEALNGTYYSDGGNFFIKEMDDDELRPGTPITLKNGILTVASDETEYYREDGFTKYVLKYNFKK